MTRVGWLIVTAALLSLPVGALAQSSADADSCDCDLSRVPGAVWWGTDSTMTVAELAAYVAPVIWFSPDEPSLYGNHGPGIEAPEPFPFQTADGPIVYYQLKEVVTASWAEARGYTEEDSSKADAVLDLDAVGLLLLEYYGYFSEESGLGAHDHDVEPVEFRLGVASTEGEYLKRFDVCCEGDEVHYVIVVTQVAGKAHGIEWFWNVVNTDADTAFPMTVLIEEGKHAMATDKNGDGYFTPSYDVNVRVNDAWGVRDIIRSGGLFSGGYQAWMTKVRNAEDRVFPPLPPDSPLHDNLARRQSHYTGGNAVYELRPLPTVAEAHAYDVAQGHGSHLAGFLEDKEVKDGPTHNQVNSLNEALSWIEAGTLKRSLSIALYSDGDYGFSWVFPFWVFKNLMVPMSGGYILHRMYVKGHNLREFGWTLLYTASASRWVDTYFAAGAEWNDVGTDGQIDLRTDFVLETGLKFRAQIGHSPIKFLSFLTDFWGFRVGIKNYGFYNIDRLTYVLELGAGSF